MSKATEHTLKLLKKGLFDYDMVERLIPMNMGVCPKVGKNGRNRPCIGFGKRHDMYGFADIVAMRKGFGILAVQSTTVNNLSGHRRDLLANPLAKKWLECGGRLFLVAWEKKHPRRKDGKASKALRWTERVEEILLHHFEPKKPRQEKPMG